MKYLSPILLVFLSVLAFADDKRPQLPKVPAGFDDGRKELVAEMAENPIKAADLLERLFEDADLTELSGFVFLHLTPSEKSLLDPLLDLGGELARARDAAAVEALLRKKELKPRKVSGALGKMLTKLEYTLGEVGAWLYARGVNFRVLQSAMNGERLDCFRLPAEWREMKAKGKGPHLLFEKGLWEFNLLDGREQPGGVYDGTQLVENLMALGWGPEEFAHAMKFKELKDMPQTTRDLMAWGDPALIWQAIELDAPETELSKAAQDYYRKQTRQGGDNPKVLEVAVRRAGAVKRWFRTGGPGVVGVYVGPWPAANGEPKAPVAAVREMEDLDAESIAAQLSDPIQAHFRNIKQTLLLVVYDDGSGRAMLRPETGSAGNYGAGSPTGNVATRDKLYEGRVTLQGRGALMYSVYAGDVTIAPTQFELVNLQLKCKGALLIADIDDGVQLTPLLLKRTTRLVEAP
jgi:hypothetical protein